jgi:hypothetical protein
MANAEEFALLETGVDAWNDWRSNNLGVRVDLSGAKLIEANLSKANLTGADLSGASLSGAVLSLASLGETDLNKAGSERGCPRQDGFLRRGSQLREPP